jgi:DNA-directed RNA polymerase specialized sigma24 family protein
VDAPALCDQPFHDRRPVLDRSAESALHVVGSTAAAAAHLGGEAPPERAAVERGAEGAEQDDGAAVTIRRTQEGVATGRNQLRTDLAEELGITAWTPRRWRGRFWSARPCRQEGQDAKDSAVTQVVDGLQHDFRMDKPTAEDIVYAVVVDLCLRHSTQPYDNLGAAFYRASANRAIKYYRRYQLRYRTCENIEDLAASCPIRFGNRFPRPDANVRLNSEVDVARRAWCSLTLQDQQILANRAIGAQTFAQIATEIGLTSGQAKDRYHNTLRRVQAQVARTCPNY